MHPLHRAEEIAEHGEAAVLRARKKQRRPARPENPPLDLGDFQAWIDRLVNADEFPL